MVKASNLTKRNEFFFFFLETMFTSYRLRQCIVIKLYFGVRKYIKIIWCVAIWRLKNISPLAHFLCHILCPNNHGMPCVGFYLFIFPF